MKYKISTPKEENPLWRNYMDKNKNLDNHEDLKEVFLPIPFSKTFATYSEWEFLEKLETDKDFNLKWGIKK